MEMKNEMTKESREYLNYVLTLWRNGEDKHPSLDKFIEMKMRSKSITNQTFDRTTYKILLQTNCDSLITKEVSFPAIIFNKFRLFISRLLFFM
jgi:hypothetical protein